MEDDIKYEIGSPEWKQMVKENEGKAAQMKKDSAARIAKFKAKIAGITNEYHTLRVR